MTMPTTATALAAAAVITNSAQRTTRYCKLQTANKRQMMAMATGGTGERGAPNSNPHPHPHARALIITGGTGLRKPGSSRRLPARYGVCRS